MLFSGTAALTNSSKKNFLILINGWLWWWPMANTKRGKLTYWVERAIRRFFSFNLSILVSQGVFGIQRKENHRQPNQPKCRHLIRDRIFFGKNPEISLRHLIFRHHRHHHSISFSSASFLFVCLFCVWHKSKQQKEMIQKKNETPSVTKQISE